MSFVKRLFSILISEPIDVEGNWSGHYGFGVQYPLSVRDKFVKFMVKINAGDNNPGAVIKNFKGSVVEDKNGVPEMAVIDGFLKGRKILFDKTYKKTYALDSGGDVYIYDESPQHIAYTGMYDHTMNKFIGQWKIEMTDRLDDGREITSIGSGYWEMERVHIKKDSTGF